MATEPGETLHVAVAGPPLHESVTVPVNPWVGVTVAVNVAGRPIGIVAEPGVTVSARSFTVSVDAVVVAEQHAFVNTARYRFPVCVATAVNESGLVVAPRMSGNVAPASVLRCHWTVGVGSPFAAALKLAVLPALTLWLFGLVVIEGAVWTVSVAAVVIAVPPE